MSAALAVLVPTHRKAQAKKTDKHIRHVIVMEASFGRFALRLLLGTTSVTAIPQRTPARVRRTTGHHGRFASRMANAGLCVEVLERRGRR